MNNTTQVHVTHAAGKKLVVLEEFSNTGRFSMTAQFVLKETMGGSLDLLDILGLLSKPSRDMFLEIKRSMSYKTNIGIFNNSAMDKSYKAKLLKELKEFDLVKRVIGSKVTFNGLPIATSTGMYMVNPKYIIPPNKYYKDIAGNWENL